MPLSEAVTSPRRCDGRIQPVAVTYQKFHSTETTLLKITDDLYKIMDDRCAAALVGLNLSAAFDTIDHEILIGWLRSRFGASGTLLGWIELYIDGRS